MEVLFSYLSRYQEIITVYILLLDTLLVRCSHSRDNKLNIRSWEKFQIKAHPSIILYLLNKEKIAEFVIQPQYKIL